MDKFKSLTKEIQAAYNDDDDDRLLDLFKKLNKVKDNMTYDILKATMIGREVGRCRKRREDVSALSTSIVDSWRHLAPSSSSNGSHKRHAKEAKKEDEEKEAVEAKPPKKKVPKAPETLAALTTRLVKRYLEPKKPRDTRDPTEVAEEFGRELERVYRDDQKKGKDLLTDYIQSLNDQDHEMRDNLMSGEWTPIQVINNLVDITPTRLKVEREEEDRLLNDKIFIHEVDMNQETDTLECPKCHGFKAKYYEKQTRSADEPMTVFARCVLCGHRWRK